MNQILRGFRHYLEAANILFRHRLWLLLLVPGLLSLLYIPGMIFLAWQYMDNLTLLLQTHALPEFLQYAWIAWALSIGIWLVALYFGFSVYRNVVMIVFSPVLGIVSEKTEKLISGRTVSPGQEATLVKAMLRGILMSLTSLLAVVASLVFCWALLLIPFIGGLLMVVLLPVSQMFLAGQGFLDPTLERKGFGIRDSFRFAWNHKLAVIGCGCGFVVLTLVPVIGWFLAPGLGIVAGTMEALHLLKEGENQRPTAAS